MPSIENDLPISLLPEKTRELQETDLTIVSLVEVDGKYTAKIEFNDIITLLRAVFGIAVGLDIGQELDSKAAEQHNHDMGEVNGLEEALLTKANTVHSHSMSAVSGLVNALAGKSDVTHIHPMAGIAGLITALAGKSDTGHTHTIDSIQNLRATLEALEAGGGLSSITIDDVQGLIAALGNKAERIHTHAVGDIINLNSLINARITTTAANAALALKADKTELTSGLATKVNISSINAPLGVLGLDNEGKIGQHLLSRIQEVIQTEFILGPNESVDPNDSLVEALGKLQTQIDALRDHLNIFTINPPQNLTATYNPS